MIIEYQNKIAATISDLYKDSKFDKFKMLKGAAKSILKSFNPENFEEVYLAISKEQGEDLVQMIKENNLRNIVEFGTSFGISTLFLAQGVLDTNGHIITTELLESKALKAIENFKKAGVADLIEVRIGDAMDTLKNHDKSIDLLLLDGWKDLYQPLFQMLEPNFNKNTIVYVDNADMAETQKFLASVSRDKYHIESKYNGKVAIIEER